MGRRRHTESRTALHHSELDGKDQKKAYVPDQFACQEAQRLGENLVDLIPDMLAAGRLQIPHGALHI